jgi:hypothetical protein
VIKFLLHGEHPVIASLLPSLFIRANQLSTEQHAGLLIACIVVSETNWGNAVTLLNAMKYDERDKALGIFKYFAATVYGDEPAMWLQENWEYFEPWHMKLIKTLKNYPKKVNQAKVL